MEYRSKIFTLIVEGSPYKKGDIFHSNNRNFVCEVTHNPRNKWYHKLLNKTTFGLFEVRDYYKITTSI